MKTFILLLGILQANLLFSQIRFTGFVKNAVTNSPIPNAQIIVKSTDVFAREIFNSDAKGFFLIKFDEKFLNKDFTLKISHSNFLNFEINGEIVVTTLQPKSYFLSPKNPKKTPESSKTISKKTSVGRELTKLNESSDADIVELNRIYDYVIEFTNKLYKVKRNNAWGLIDKKGKVIQELKYKEIKALQNGLAWFDIGEWSLDQLWGAFDASGKIVINPKYVFLKIDCGAIRVSTYDGSNYRAGLLSLNGKELFDFEDRRYQGMADCCNGIIPVRKIGSEDSNFWGAIDSSGKEIYPFTYKKDDLLKKLGCAN